MTPCGYAGTPAGMRPRTGLRENGASASPSGTGASTRRSVLESARKPAPKLPTTLAEVLVLYLGAYFKFMHIQVEYGSGLWSADTAARNATAVLPGIQQASFGIECCTTPSIRSLYRSYTGATSETLAAGTTLDQRPQQGCRNAQSGAPPTAAVGGSRLGGLDLPR